MRTALLIVSLWVLLDVVLVAALVLARHAYSAMRRMQRARRGAPARSRPVRLS